MACFIAALAESAVAYGVKKACEHHGTERSLIWAKRIGTLITMLLGGSFLLMIEHVWHGEISASFRSSRQCRTLRTRRQWSMRS